jgi:membrane-bound ClpP family serine protease
VAARAEQPEVVGRFISVPTPLRGESINRIRQTVDSAFLDFKRAEQERDRQQPDQKKRRHFKVVFDFTPDGKASRSDNFGLCLELAEVIHRLPQGVQTVAFVHGEVAGHSVLPVLACQQIVMSARAKLGPVLLDGGATLDKWKQEGYVKIAVRLAPVLVRKLFDRDLVVVPSKEGGFVAADSPQAVPAGRPVFEAGTLAVYTHAKAADVKLCDNQVRNPYETREDVARAYNLPRDSLHETTLVDRTVAWLIPVTGEVNGALAEQIKRRTRRATGAGANLLIYELKCHGGDTAVAADIADYLLNINKNRPDDPVLTIAYVTRDSHDTAVYLALGCSRIVVDKEAKLGGFGKLLKGRPAAELKAIGEGMEDLARKQFYPPVLARAFVDPGDKPATRQLYHVRSTTGASEEAFLTEEQWNAEREDPKRRNKWQLVPENFQLDDGFLTLSADQAQRFYLAGYTVSDLNGLYAREGLTPSQVKTSGPDWLDDLADFLRNDWTSFLLIMIGITCLILELKMPGVGLPGIIAAVCFVLYFWSHSQFGGQVTWLAILLFLLGLILLGIEIFIIPGFGVCGISGIILVIGSLALVAHGHWPQNGGDWLQLSKNVGPLGLCLMGSVVLAVMLARYLPSIPFANRLMLKPQTEAEGIEALEPAPSAHAALLGAIGVAATPLRPAGKVQFGDQFVDVVAEGSYVAPGTRVQVIEIEGNRIVVKQV